MGQNSSKLKLQSSLRPILAKGGWIVKASVASAGGILIVMINIHNKETKVQYCMSEKDAAMFIDLVTN